MEQYSWLQLLLSWYRSRVLDIQRLYDYSWRKLTGAPTRRFSMITPHLFLGGQHSRHRGLHMLKRRGITAIVNMRISSINLAHIDWVKTLHLPTVDQHAPTMDQLKQGVEFIAEEIKRQGKVYIHCKQGEGRGPTMVIAYLISTGMTLEDALTAVRKVRTFIRPTLVQLERLREFTLLYAK